MHVWQEREGGEGTKKGEREERLGLSGTGNSINKDMSLLICPSGGNECESVCSCLETEKFRNRTEISVPHTIMLSNASQ